MLLESADLLPVAISGVRKPQITSFWMLDNIVEGREVFSEKVVYQYPAFIGRWIYKNQLRWVDEVPFITEDNLLTLATVRWSSYWVERGTSVGLMDHGIPQGLYFIIVVDVDRSDIDGIVEASIPVGSYIELGRRLAYVWLMIVRIVIVTGACA